MLTSLLDKYQALVRELGAYPVRAVDTNGGNDAKNSAYAIASDLLGCFSQKLSGAP
ncbi:MAG: hypothetical protein JOZ72_19710 [Alphaproteobacteria bacterium]|nr:hypothetical protein [Alphaproteobacteria bacterium]